MYILLEMLAMQELKFMHKPFKKSSATNVLQTNFATYNLLEMLHLYINFSGNVLLQKFCKQTLLRTFSLKC